MRRFFFDPDSRKEDVVSFAREESKHIVKVLRLEDGAEVELFDGRGNLFRGELSIPTGGRTRVLTARITARLENPEDNGPKLTVIQGFLKGDKMDTVVQKCTELGVNTFCPAFFSRCQGRPAHHNSEKKLTRWERIGLASCKQCMRTRPMEIFRPGTFSEIIGMDVITAAELKLLFWEEEKETTLHNLNVVRDMKKLGNISSVAVILGPEGGISPEEVRLAREKGFVSVSLGKRVLRAETATVAAAALVQFLTGRI